jgi:GT2 family glycosyltransferase
MLETTIRARGIPVPAPRVGVVIVTWNKKPFILELLADLQARPYPNWEVVVVDNVSTDGTLEAIEQKHPWVHTIKTGMNLGGSGGFNTGLQYMLAQGGYDYVWLLDNDVTLEPGALEVLVETLESRPDAGVAGSHMIQMDQNTVTNEIGGDVDLPGGRLLLNLHNSYERIHTREVYEVDYVAACSLLVRYSVLQEVGIWDDFFIHYDDVDWCLRIRAAGYRTLACAASRIHHMSARTKPVTWMLYYDIRNVLYLQHKHQIFRPLHCAGFIGLLLYYSLRDELSGKGYYGKLVERAILDFLAGRMGKGETLPTLSLKPAKAVLAGLLTTESTILILEPTRRAVFAAKELEGVSHYRSRITGVCHEYDLKHTALPAEAPRIRLSHHRLVMAAQLMRMAFFRRHADYLIVEVDKPCGLLGLCARRIIILVDDQCLEVRGGFIRLLIACQWPFRGLRIYWYFLLFCLRRSRLPRGL